MPQISPGLHQLLKRVQLTLVEDPSVATTDVQSVLSSAKLDLWSLLPLLTPPSSLTESLFLDSGIGRKSPDVLRTITARLRMVLTSARQMVDAGPFHLVSSSTLKSYTDASILLAVVHFMHLYLPGAPSQSRMEEEWRKVLEMLDRAIIVAGAVGEGRREVVQDLIAFLQPEYSPMRKGVKRSREPSHTPSLSPSASGPSCPVIPRPPEDREAGERRPLFAPAAIPAHPPGDHPPTLSDTPFIIKGYLVSGKHHPAWPAITKWRDAGYLLSKTGLGRTVPVEIGHSYDDQGWTQKLVPWEWFMEKAGWDMGSLPDTLKGKGKSPAAIEKRDITEDHTPLYLAQTSLFTQFAALERDIATPDYVWSSPPGSSLEEPLINVWVGPGGHEVVSPAHTDPYWNCYAQVLGRKRVWVAPPDSSPHMYAYGGGETSPAAPSVSDGIQHPTGEGSATLADEYMDNTSRVPLLRPIHNPDFRSLQDFPDFFEQVYPRAMEAVLDPGDMLVLPPRWWHAMRGEGAGPCWSISFWF